MANERLAPAKVNLFLHVGPVGADGYHPICSLMTFANVGDVVRLSPARDLTFDIQGPFGEPLSGDLAGNLVVRARDAVLQTFEPPWPAFRLSLDKRLPIAAGLGGGSADAAATLRLLAEAFPMEWDELLEIARDLGSDVTACLSSLPVLARGRGDQIEEPAPFPDIDAVLVNPLVPSSTARVYAAFDASGAPAEAEAPVWPAWIETPRALAELLTETRNDLEAPAVALQPAIAEVLRALRGRTETLFARMSGSGATCFALCANPHQQRDLAFAIAAAHPAWWVQPCVLAGYRP